MNKLPIDIIKLIALYLDFQDILSLLKVNKRFNYLIENDEKLWQKLILNITTNISFSENKRIEWYKYKLWQYPKISILVKLIREGGITVDINPPNFCNNDFEFANNITFLEFHNININLPDMPNIQQLNCQGNKLTKLPDMPNLQRLYCQNNNLVDLPSFPDLRILSCYGNRIRELPFYPNLIMLNCDDIITNIPKTKRLNVYPVSSYIKLKYKVNRLFTLYFSNKIIDIGGFIILTSFLYFYR